VRALLVLAALLLFPAAASAQDVGAAAAALGSSEYVYVDPSAEAAAEVDAAALEAAIRDSGKPVFVAVLPGSAAEGATPDATLEALHDAVGVRGTYALLVGREFRAGSDDGSLDATTKATAALRDHPGDIQAVLVDFVGRLDDAGSSSGPPWVLLALFALIPLFILIVFVGIVVAVVRSTRAHRRTREREMADLKAGVRDDLIALAEDIRALELDMQMPGASPEAQRAYASAVEAYERANRIWERAQRPKDLKPAAEELAEGRYALLWAREVLAGRTPPERRTPCFFDPRHGPSSRDVAWAPPGETPRAVPACEADAARVARGEQPDVRYVESDGRRVPFYEAGPAFAPFYSGFFGGLVIGSMVPGGWDNPTPSDYSGSSGWTSGGGDFGGGGGGGDFGGGGGGDFGGGSF
jgi:uncharacterized membrane protein YgcG